MKWHYFVTGDIFALKNTLNKIPRRFMLANLIEHQPHNINAYRSAIIDLDQHFKDQIITVKLSNFEYNHAQCVDFFGELIENSHNQWNFDAEELKYSNIYNNIVNHIIIMSPPKRVIKTYQAYCPTTGLNIVSDILQFGDTFSIKLVRGAYHNYEMKQPGSIIYREKEKTDSEFRRAMNTIINQSNNQLIIASHNQQDVETIINKYRETGDERFQTAQLIGMSQILQQKVIDSGIPSYLYVPYGTLWQCVPYLSRRLYENFDMIKYII